MITRFALFEGKVHEGQVDAFRAAVLAEILPRWKEFPGATAVRVCFADDRDDGAPEFPMILAVSYPDRGATLTSSAAPGMVYDYQGFPAETYRIRYASPGAPALASWAAALLRASAALPR